MSTSSVFIRNVTFIWLLLSTQTVLCHKCLHLCFFFSLYWHNFNLFRQVVCFLCLPGNNNIPIDKNRKNRPILCYENSRFLLHYLDFGLCLTFTLFASCSVSLSCCLSGGLHEMIFFFIKQAAHALLLSVCLPSGYKIDMQSQRGFGSVVINEELCHDMSFQHDLLRTFLLLTWENSLLIKI